MKKEFHWNDETIQYFVDRLDADGWPCVASLIWNFVWDECDLEDGETEKDLFDDLCEKVYSKDIEDNHPWAKAEDDHPHWIEDHRKK
jgi:hypothetical protein